MVKHGQAPHSHRGRQAVVGAAIVIFAALAVFGLVTLLPSGGVTTAPAAAAPVGVLPGAAAPEPAHEHHIAVAEATPAGADAATASQRVIGDRQAAAANPAAVALQARLDQATGGPLMFGPDTATLSPASRDKLAAIVDVLRSSPAARVEIVGHTAVEINDPPLCLQLSQLRAEQVANRLAMAGIDPDRVPAIGVSHMQPKDTAAESRRVELVVLA